MTKFVREYMEVPEHASLDEVIGMLTALRETLPAGAEAEIRMKGDDVFGRHLSICYMRPQSDAEAALEARYTNARRDVRLSAVPADVAAYERIEGEVSLAA